MAKRGDWPARSSAWRQSGGNNRAKDEDAWGRLCDFAQNDLWRKQGETEGKWKTVDSAPLLRPIEALHLED